MKKKFYLLYIWGLGIGEEFNITINDDVKLNINGDQQNCNGNEIDKVKSSFVYTYYNNFTVESSKERVNYKLHVKKVGNYTIPSSFFYVLLKIKFSEITIIQLKMIVKKLILIVY